MHRYYTIKDDDDNPYIWDIFKNKFHIFANLKFVSFQITAVVFNYIGTQETRQILELDNADAEDWVYEWCSEDRNVTMKSV